MIRINRSPKPEKLTRAEQKKLTVAFKTDRKRVWNKLYIKQTLLEMTHRKCVYCETVIGETAKYMEVEHYCPKEAYPDRVIEWENLLPSCKRCNGKKGTYDPECNPFIHPVNDLPNVHLALKQNGRVSGLDEKGKASVKRLDLNHYDGIRRPRLRIIYEIRQRIKGLCDDIQAQSLKEMPALQKKAKQRMRAILLETRPRSAYSAYISAEVLNDKNFEVVVEWMRNEEIWTEELERLRLQATYHAFQKRT